MNTRLEIVEAGEAVQPDVAFKSGSHTLKGRVFHPRSAPRAVVVLNAATGVPARFYHAFAAWLAETQELACLTYDYRDFGASKRAHPRRSTATMADWGVHDQDAARHFAMRNFPGVPVWVLGHSLGGLCLPFQTDLDKIARVITVGSGAIHVRDHPWPYQALVRLFWSAPVRALAELAGYLPGRALRLGPDVPLGVYRQWRRWCTSPGFYHSDVGHSLPPANWTGLTAPMTFIACSDDVMVPPVAVWRLMQNYPEARKTQHVLRPAAFQLETLGHIDIFAEKNRAAWPAIVA